MLTFPFESEVWYVRQKKARRCVYFTSWSDEFQEQIAEGFWNGGRKSAGNG
jgi:hypothetical protein